MFLESESTEKPISLYINSPGGSVTAGMAIYDTVSFFIVVFIVTITTNTLFLSVDAGTIYNEAILFIDWVI